MAHGSLHIDIIFTHILTHIMERDLHGQSALIKMEIAHILRILGLELVWSKAHSFLRIP
jgi:hypothetical protein